MHVGYVLKKFPRASETFVLNEILELQRQGVQVTVFSLHRPDDGVFHRGLSDLEQPVRYLAARKSTAVLDDLRALLPVLRLRREELWEELDDLVEGGRADLWPILHWAMDVTALARELGVQRLHAHFATVAAYVARAAARVLDLPFSITCHAKDIYRQGVEPARFQALARHAEFTVTVCGANRAHIRDRLAGDCELDVRVVYNGVDLALFHPENRRPDAEPLVLGVGRLVEKKGFHNLVSASGRLLEQGRLLRCAIVGEGDQRSRLETAIAALGTDRIQLSGIRTQDEIRGMLARAAVVALPCIVGTDGNRDALPTVLLEAMASGVPVISTPVGGVPEILDGGAAGLQVPEGDPDALAGAIAEVIDSPDLAAELGRRGRARAEELFDLRKNVARLAHFFGSGRRQAETVR